MSKNKKSITFFSTALYPDCRGAKQYFDDRGVVYEYIDIDKNPEAVSKVIGDNKMFNVSLIV